MASFFGAQRAESFKPSTVAELENKRNTKIIVLNHGINKSGITSLLDNQQYLSRNDALNVVRSIRNIPTDKTIEIILNTPGGSMAAAEVIVNALLNHKGKVIAYVPQYAMSAGLIIALAADEIYLEKNAYMGPADPQYFLGYSAASILDYTKQIISSSWVSDIITLAKGDAEKSMTWVKELIEKIYSKKNLTLDDDGFDTLFGGKYNHDRPLFIDDLSKLIPFIKEGVPDEIYDFYQKYLIYA